MATGRVYHTATLLKDGKVLVTGGTDMIFLASAEIYDPSIGTFATVGSMSTPRVHHTATLLGDGRVLVAGGDGNGFPGQDGIPTAEIFDPSTATFGTTFAMKARAGPTATVLRDGRILLAGGTGLAEEFDYLADSYVFDLTSGQFSLAGKMNSGRAYHTATLLPNGQVLIAGGELGWVNISSTDLYDPASSTFLCATNMAAQRSCHTETLLRDGRVLITGGWWSDGSSAELYTQLP